LSIGDGALGFWGALAEVYPTCRKQRCVVHKKRNVLDKLPERLREEAKGFFDEIITAERRSDALLAADRFEEA
jgi:transposase-like protein